MDKDYPYHIVHLNLAESLQVPSLETLANGNYLVFWWNDIPLSQAFLKPEADLDSAGFASLLVYALESTLIFYSEKNDFPLPKGWEHWITACDLPSFNACMEKLLEKDFPTVLPETVPVSVIICTRNRPEHLKNCLNQFKQLHCQPKEILVVDNAPSDDATFLVVQQFKAVKYFKEERKGLDFARNAGANRATQPIIAYTDDDVMVHPWWVYRVHEVLQNPELAAMTGLVIAAELNTPAQLAFEKNWSFNKGYRALYFDRNFLIDHLKRAPPVWKIGAGANMAFKKEALRAVGLFDERLDVGQAGCSGDSEVWFRILNQGYHIQYDPKAVVFHQHRRDMKGFENQIYNYMKGHAVAALIQHGDLPEAGYRKRIFFDLPYNYTKKILLHAYKNKTGMKLFWVRLKGVLAGIIFYLKNQKRNV